MKILKKPFVIIAYIYKNLGINVPKINFLKDPTKNRLHTHDLHYMTLPDLQQLFLKESFKLMSNIIKCPTELGLSSQEAGELLEVFTSIRDLNLFRDRDIIINPRLRLILFKSISLPYIRWAVIKNSKVYPITRSSDFAQFKHMLRKICK